MTAPRTDGHGVRSPERRRLVADALRVAAALAGLGGVSALARRPGRCVAATPCAECARLRGCALPRASRARARSERDG